MKPETIIKLVSLGLFLIAFNISFDLGLGSSSHNEMAEVIDAKKVMTSSMYTGNYSFSARGQTNMLRVKLQNGRTIPIDVKENVLPEVGSYIQIEVREGFLFGNSYRMTGY